MIEGRYLVQDDSWKQYRSANAIKEWLPSRIGLKGEKGSEIDLLIKRIAESIGKDTLQPSLITAEEQKIMYQSYTLMELVILKVERNNNLLFDVRFHQQHLWLLDDLGNRLMSGLIDLLCVDPNKKVGFVLKHTFEPVRPLPAQEDKELLALALIAAEALDLKEVRVGILNYEPFAIDFGAYTTVALQLFKNHIHKRLGLIDELGEL